MKFEDHFSKHARVYARYRPPYPNQLFDYLASVAPGRQLAWDCGTGNGQAALQLVNHFDRVVATDASADQIAQASLHPRIDYRIEPAEAVSLEARSVDLVTVAVAVHWFELELFYQEVRRVLKSGGILAVWTYHLPLIEPAIDRILERYYRQVLAGYWPERIRYIEQRYRTLQFPFQRLSPPDFELEMVWDMEELLGFLDSWSATRRYLEEQGEHPLRLIWRELETVWGDTAEKRLIRWPLSILVGKGA